MADPAEWLEARLAEVEALANAATPGPWRYNPRKHWREPGTSRFEEAVFSGPPGAEAVCVAGTGESDDQQSMRDADHIAFWDPPTVLQLIAGTRQLLELHKRTQLDVVVHRGLDQPLGKRTRLACSHCDDGYQELMDWPCPTLLVLAAG